MARASCLYCGGALGAAAEITEAAETARQAREHDPRSLVVLDLADVEPPELADAFRLPAAETAQWVRRGGFRLTTSAASPDDAASEVERLGSLGLRAFALDGADVAVARAPYEAEGVDFRGGLLRARHASGFHEIGPDDALLLVKGPIRREYQATTERRKFRLATLEQGYLFHLHLSQDLRPLELDPNAIEFDAKTGPGSSLLRLNEWLRQVGAAWPADDGFRLLPPALGLEQPSSGPMKLAAALHGGRDDASQVLDNVGQFRFYSAWRGLVQRELRSP